MGISCVFLLRRILVFRCVEAITIVDSNVGCLAVTTAAAAAVFVVVVLLLYCCYSFGCSYYTAITTGLLLMTQSLRLLAFPW